VAKEAASKVNINPTEMSNSAVPIVEHLIEDVATEVVQITFKISLAEMITPTLGRQDRGYTKTWIFDLTLLATTTRNQQGTRVVNGNSGMEKETKRKEAPQTITFTTHLRLDKGALI
jgi:hypothetical protein